MLVPIGAQLVNEDDVLYIIQQGPTTIRVLFRNGAVLNIASADPPKDLQVCAAYLVNKNA